MRYEEICCDISDGIATLTLNRPANRNAYTPDMGEELVHAIRAAQVDDTVRVLLLTGAGQGFCAGADREFLAGKRGRLGQALGEEAFINEFPAELAESAKPLVALVNGDAVGIGVTMILPFDLRIAATDARFALPFMKLGIVPGLGSTRLLPRLVGVAKAVELILCNATVDAHEAVAIGLVNQVVPAERLMQTGRAIAASMVQCRPEAIGAVKRALAFGARADLRTTLANERAENAGLRALRSC